mgnify:CR=1 FL=1
MTIFKLSLKLLSTHAVMSIIQFVLMLPLFGIFTDNQIYQWIIGILFIGIFWLVIYGDMSSNGLQDAKSGKYKSHKGFIAGLLCTIPGIILYIATILYEPDISNKINWFNVILRIWLSPYIKIFNSLESSMPHPALVVNMLLPIVAGISYMDGLRQQKKIRDVIEEADKTKIEKSKIGYKK